MNSFRNLQGFSSRSHPMQLDLTSWTTAQFVRLCKCISPTVTLCIGAPQGCALRLYNLYTHDCIPSYSGNHIIKFAGDAKVLGLISYSDESARRKEAQGLAVWWRSHNLMLNIKKTKEVIVDSCVAAFMSNTEGCSLSEKTEFSGN